VPTILNPYLNFSGQAREAMDFYRSVFGGELIGSTYEEFQMAADPSENELMMHSQLTTPGGMTLMAGDVSPRTGITLGTVSIALSGDDKVELTGYWASLSEGATIGEELTKAPWGDSFGQLTDRFGVRWLVNIAAPKPDAE
jgi:PhnB protein